jgi:uncharacterized membrane-anchored protein
MTIDVEVHLSIPIINEQVRKKLERKFNAIHDQTFKQRVNYNASNDFKGEVKEMRHDGNTEPKWIWVDTQTFFIPAHWDIEHAKHTQKDIKQILREWGKVKFRTRVSA